MSDIEVLRNFLLDRDLLEKIENNFSDKPNIFSILKITDREIRHSNLLAWLLNPKENHNINKIFLEKLIESYVKEYVTIDKTMKLLLVDYNHFTVKREWNNIDLLLLSEEDKLVIAIENKINTKEHDHQLERYYDIVKDTFPDYEAHFIFLTLDGSNASEMGDIWHAMSYTTIVAIIEDIINKQSLNDEVKLVLENYVETVRSLIKMENPEIKELCMQIYEKHKKAIDLIIDNIPMNENMFLTDLSNWIKTDWSKKLNFKNINNHKWFEFYTPLMDEVLPNINGNNAYRYYITLDANPLYCKIVFELQYDGLMNTPTYDFAKLIDLKINNRNLDERGRMNTTKWSYYGFKTWQIDFSNVNDDNYEIYRDHIKQQFEKILFEDIPNLEKEIKDIYDER